jgi:CelD/BcsL family acetyltransferase involved in cellulose biosynthesis
MTVEIIKDFSQCKRLIAAWDDLAQSTVEPNVFYESWHLIPALSLLADKHKVFLVLIWAEKISTNNDNPQLIGIFPFEVQEKHARLPISCLSLWKHPHCFLCTPLIRTGHEEACLTQLIDWFDRDKSYRILRLSDIRADGPLLRQLERVLQEQRRQTDCTCYERALLESKLDGNSYLRKSLSRKSRTEFERQMRRLASLGNLELRHLTQHDNVQEWIKTFLTLEGSGWKGRAGTAINCCKQQTEYLRLILHAAFKNRQLTVSMLTLNEEPIAVRCSFTTNGVAFAFKTAFDERFAKYSPGVQLEFAITRLVLDNPNIAWMDSCSDPKQSLFNRLWTERRMIYHLAISRQDFFSTTILRIIKGLRHLLKR